MLGLICWRATREKGILIDMIDMLVAYGADPNHGFGRGSLENALWHGETDAGHALLRHGAKCDFRIAAGLGRIDLMDTYFNENGSLDAAAYALAPPIGEGCERELSDAEILADAVSMATINWQFETIDYLVAKGADVSALCEFVHGGGITPLHHACSENTWDTDRTGPQMVEHLLAHGANPTTTDAHVRATPIDWPIHNQHRDIFGYLVQRPECVRDLDDHLRYAVQRSETQMVEHALEAGANPEITCGPEREPLLGVARSVGNEGIVVMLEAALGG